MKCGYIAAAVDLVILQLLTVKVNVLSLIGINCQLTKCMCQHDCACFSESKTDNIIISQAKISYFMSASVYEPRVTDYVVYLNTESKSSRECDIS